MGVAGLGKSAIWEMCGGIIWCDGEEAIWRFSGPGRGCCGDKLVRAVLWARWKGRQLFPVIKELRLWDGASDSGIR